MNPPTDLEKVEEVMALLRKAHRLVAILSPPASDLDSLLSVAESEAKRHYADIVSASTRPHAIPLILSSEAPGRPKGSGQGN